MKRIFLGLIIFAIVTVLALTLFFLLKNNQPAIVQPVSGITVLFPKPNDIISSPLKITGIVNGSGWTGFEGQVGTVRLLDSNGKELTKTFLKATTEWTTFPTNFEANLEFMAPAGSDRNGSLVFHNENASGDPVRDKTVMLPIEFR